MIRAPVVLRLCCAVWCWLVVSAAATWAACSDVRAMSPVWLEDTPVSTIQTGLRAALQDRNRLLSDGTLGPYTRNRLQDICDQIPRPEGSNDIRSTLDLVTEYAALEGFAPGWAERLGTLDLRAEPTLAMRLAATPLMTAHVFDPEGSPVLCNDLAASVDKSEDAKRAMAILFRLLGKKSETAVCELLPIAAAPPQFAAAMARLGQLEAALPGTLADLYSPEFADWLDAERDVRRLRLVGSDAAVLRLMQDYAAQKPNDPVVELPPFSPCSRDTVDDTLTYYALSQAEIDGFEFATNLSPVLEGFRADNPRFDSKRALWGALKPALEPILDDCVVAQVEELVFGPDQIALEFALNPKTVETLLVNEELQPTKPVLDEFAPRRATTAEDLHDGIRAALLSQETDAALAEAEEAADTIAAASEPVKPIFDTAQAGVEVPEVETPPTIAVTAATDQALENSIDNTQFTETIRGTPFEVATTPELIKSQARGVLRDLAKDQARLAVDAQMREIDEAIAANWTMTNALEQAILGLPDVKLAATDETANNLPPQMTQLAGIEYPSFRLFDRALDSLTDAEGTPLWLSPFVRDRIIQVAQKVIDDPQVVREFGPLQIDKCDCVARRIEEGLTVYGFWPFWFAPTPAKPDAPKADDETAETAADVLQKVNFNMVGQLAFYGLEFSFDNPDLAPEVRRVTLKNANQWRAAKRDFINSAHRHRARADLAFDLRRWMDWTDANVTSVAEQIAAEMAPFQRFRSYDFEHIGEAIPTLFDKVQADGVTLIFHGYQGTKLDDQDMLRLVSIVKSVYEELPNRARIKINVAFDFPLVGEDLDSPLFDDLYALLVEQPYTVTEAGDQDPAKPPQLERVTTEIVDKVLLFLERPTTEAKKGLRFRMEQGLFQGKERDNALRSIIPVLPPSGHREVRQSDKENPNKSERPTQFSQFDDDVVYFAANFAGVGFWPSPRQSDPETEEIEKIIAKRYNAGRVHPVLAGVGGLIVRTCGFTCPNRAYIALMAMALFVAIVVLTVRSFYSGTADKYAFRVLLFGLVWIGNAIVLAMLLLLWRCDHMSVWPRIAFIGMAASLGLLLFYNFLQRVRNGPMP